MKATHKRPARESYRKIAWSWVGSFIGILLVSTYNDTFGLFGVDGIFLVGSFGASAVLIFGSPMADYSQPRNLVLGHVISAVIGVCAYWLLPELPNVAGALAVSCALVIMHLTSTMHPPGGGNALLAVIGSQQIHSLGFWYVLTPILSGVVILLVVALVVNNLSSDPHRHYPKFWW